MSRHNERLPCDTKPTTAMVRALRWQRESIHQRRQSVAAEKMEEARSMRAAYQYELLRRLASTAVSFFHRQHVAEDEQEAPAHLEKGECKRQSLKSLGDGQMRLATQCMNLDEES